MLVNMRALGLFDILKNVNLVGGTGIEPVASTV